MSSVILLAGSACAASVCSAVMFAPAFVQLSVLAGRQLLVAALSLAGEAMEFR